MLRQPACLVVMPLLPFASLARWMHAASSSWRPISEDWPPGGGGIDPLEGPHSLADNQPLDCRLS